MLEAASTTKPEKRKRPAPTRPATEEGERRRMSASGEVSNSVVWRKAVVTPESRPKATKKAKAAAPVAWIAVGALCLIALGLVIALLLR